jgi:hypothetical protein
MRIFLILVTLGLAFMVYALIQFFRETKRRSSVRQRDSNWKTVGTRPGRLVRMDSMQSVRKQPLLNALCRME